MEEFRTDTMTCTFEYNEEHDFVEVQVTGTMDDEAFPEAVEMYWSILKENDCQKSLSDYRNFNFTKNTFEIYARPQVVVEVTGTTRIKMAVLVNTINQDYRFLETVYLNFGITIKLFTEPDEAIQWLGASEE
jgi:hypothetical protein